MLGFAEHILSHVDEVARLSPSRVAVVCAGGEGAGPLSPQITYADLPYRVGAAARGLKALGVGHGSVVGLHLPNSPEFIVAFFAIAAVGATVTPSNPAYSVPELAYQLRDSRAQLLVTSPGLAATATQATASAGLSPSAVFVLGEPATRFLHADAAAQRNLPEFESIGDISKALLALPYSSGTTGLPKGVMLSHLNVLSNVEQCGVLPFEQDGTDVIISVLPFYHIYGLTTILAAALRYGGMIVSQPKFDPMIFLQAIVRHRVTYVPLVPPLVAFLAKHPAVASFDLSCVRSVFSGAAPLDPVTQLAVEKRIPGARCRQGYGMTETAPVTNVASVNAPSRPGSSGPPVAGTEIRVVDVSTEDPVGSPRLLPAGSANVGELQVHGPQVMLGYLNNSKATAETLLPDGWLRTGDLAYFDSDGHVFVVDRLKELIKVKGLQVAPAELEGLLLTHELVYDAAVVGRADERSGEVPVAFVVPRATMLRALGKAAEADALKPLTAEAVKDFVAAKVAPYKRLDEVVFVDVIPKTPSGKILRRVLRERVKAGTK
jgi:acyl-CoA synthetase (AMP-forming)/AMP-acid ligase II